MVKEYLGVTYHSECPLGHQWKATIFINGNYVNLGFYETDRLAALAYDKMAAKHGKPTNILKPKK